MDSVSPRITRRQFVASSSAALAAGSFVSQAFAAISPVAGNVPLELSLPNALRMVEIAGRTDIPVAVGAKAPLLRRLVTAAYAHGENGLGGAVFPEPKIKALAVPASELIRQIVRRYPNEVTLI